MDKSATPSLLPIFRSLLARAQATQLVADSTVEYTITELAQRTGVPYPSVRREIERALAVELVSERLVGRTWVISADTTSPYFSGLSDVL